MLDRFGIYRVYPWGPPECLEDGTNREVYSDMIDSFDKAARIGADVMRVVGSSLMFRNQPHGPQVERLTGMFREAVKVAEEYGIRMAVENHIDFTADEMLATGGSELALARRQLRYGELSAFARRPYQ